jgi:FeS assembly SUF system protein
MDANDLAERNALNEKVIDVLKTIKDPEIPVNIYDLGLIYEIEIQAFGVVDVRMTLTAPACPVADAIVQEVQDKLNAIPEASGAYVELVWEPAWTKARMTDEARLELNLD